MAFTATTADIDTNSTLFLKHILILLNTCFLEHFVPCHGFVALSTAWSHTALPIVTENSGCLPRIWAQIRALFGRPNLNVHLF